MAESEIYNLNLEFKQPYFWTATINKWKHLMQEDTMKIEVIRSLQWLKQNHLIELYAYVCYAESRTLCLVYACKEWKRIATRFLFEIYGTSFLNIYYARQLHIC